MKTSIKQLGFLFLIISALLFACTPTNKPTLNELLHNPASMTKELENLDNNLSVDVIESVFRARHYERIVSIKLSNNPVIVAVSIADKNSPKFIDILMNADTQPIGKVLFAKNSRIKRHANMQIKHIKLAQIKTKTIKNYIRNLGYVNNDNLYQRISVFYYKNQSMQLTEYFLPTINEYLNK